MNDSRRGPRDGRGISRPSAPVEPSRPRAHDVGEDRRPMAPVSSALMANRRGEPVAPPAPGLDVALPDGTYKMYALLSHPQARARIAPLLVPGGTEADKDEAWERVVANVMRASRNDPKIERCRGTTILDSVATIVGAWHLEIGETADLVPFKNSDNTFTCTAIMRYTGMSQLMLASGAVRKINTWCYYENEIATKNFVVTAGTNAGIFHNPMRHKERGKLAGAYVVAMMRGQVEMWSYMPIEDIEVIRAKSRSWSPRASGLEECPEWYAKKTALRQFAKLIPKSREIMRAFKHIQQDEYSELAAFDSDASPHHIMGVPEESRALQSGEIPPVPEAAPAHDGPPPGTPAADEWQDDRDLVDDDGVSR